MRLLLTLALCLPATAFAAGSGGGTSIQTPKPTETTKNCKGVRVWDDAKKRCVKPKQSSLEQDELMQAVRELAYAGRNTDAQGVLSAMQDQSDDLVLTYWGFTHRKLGNLEVAQAFYEQALDQNPDNLLARSYMGQGMVTAGDTEGAIAQWREIKARGGEGSWAEASLREAIRSGITYNY